MTDKAKMYALKNDEGEWLGCWFDHGGLIWDTRSIAEENAKLYGGHVVTLIEEQKVKLPREVGEDLEDWLKTDNIDDILDKIICIYDGDHSVVRNWWASTLGATYLIADMARYGWEAETEAKWYVQTPKEWWEQPNAPEYIILDQIGIVSGIVGKKIAYKFTRAEIKRYHLDSDIFTLVPVEADKEVS